MKCKKRDSLQDFITLLVEENLKEMPIQQFKTVGDWTKRSSFSHPVDRALLTSPKAVTKIKRQWEKTPYEFDIYLVNDPRVNSSDFKELGERPLEFVRKEMGITEEEIPNPSSDAITVIFTNNSGDERYMASGWILAHRLGHAFARGYGDYNLNWQNYTDNLRELFNGILSDVYGIDSKSSATKWGTTQDRDKEKLLKYVAQEMGTMKSARDKKLRNWYELGYELFAQYLLTGRITLNRLPNSLVIGLGGWGRKKTANVKEPEIQNMYNNHDLDYYSSELENYIESVLDAAQGKIFIM